MTATVIVNGRNIGVSDNVRDYAEKKMSKLDHYLAEITEVRVDIAVERTAKAVDDRQVVQITIPLKGTLLRCEERSGEVMTSLDMALDKVQRQIKRYKDRHRHGRGNTADSAKIALETEPDEEPEADEQTGPRVMRRKQFQVTPMTEEEAIEQMALIQHDNFFIFINASTSRMNVLYQRKDGNLGLIEPEMG
jgi:putative sigma-54 modulation protein